jgi:hypothetical protein
VGNSEGGDVEALAGGDIAELKAKGYPKTAGRLTTLVFILTREIFSAAPSG